LSRLSRTSVSRIAIEARSRRKTDALAPITGAIPNERQAVRQFAFHVLSCPSARRRPGYDGQLTESLPGSVDIGG
jgi:hypothetical protein